MVAPYMAHEVRHPFVNTAPVTLDVFDHPVAAPMASQFERLSTEFSTELTDELDGAAEWLDVQVEEILLAALGRTLGRTRGEGAVDVDVTGGHRWLCHPVSLICSAGNPMGPTEMLQGAHTSLASAPGHASAKSEVLLNVAGSILDDESAERALELRVQRIGGDLRFDWWYDAARFDGYSVEEMAEQFPQAVIEITSDAARPI